MKRILSVILTVVLLLNMVPMPIHAHAHEHEAEAAATATHSHPVCGSYCRCPSDDHTSSTWTAWDGTAKMYNGDYYLTKDLVLSSTMILDYSYGSHLCPNGHSITCEDTVFDIYSYRSLLITWSAVTGTQKYLIYVKSGSSWKKLTDTTATSYTWGGAEKGMTYTFTVRCLAFDGKTYLSNYNTSGWSYTYE